MLKACSHLVIATENVERMTGFFAETFECQPHFSNALFSEFVLESGFRIAFFKPVGESSKRFNSQGSRKALSIGLTVGDVRGFHARISGEMERLGGELSGPPKEHPWGEASFLLIDPDGNRWEITQSPSENGMLINRPE